MISKDDVQKLADLAHLAVPDEEMERVVGEMDAILAYVADVKKLAGDDVQAKPELYNVMRDDVVTNERGEFTERIVSQFPDREGNALRVKKIL